MRATFDQDTDDESAPALGHRRRAMEPGDLDITPMIDVTFLLLIFFMVTSTMKEPVPADVPPARNGRGIEAGESLVVTITRPNNAGETLVQLPDGAEQTLEQLQETEALTKQIQNRADDGGEVRVILNADRDLPHGVVRTVSEMIGQVEGARLFLGVQDE